MLDLLDKIHVIFASKIGAGHVLKEKNVCNHSFCSFTKNKQTSERSHYCDCGSRYENLDCTKNQSDCRICYCTSWKKINIIQSYFCSCFIEKNFRSIEDIRKELEGADIFVKKDIEIIKKHVETLNSTSSSLPEKEHALDELEFYVHQIDNGIDLDTIGGLTLVIKLMNSTDPSLVRRATYVLGSATQRWLIHLQQCHYF